MFFDLLYKAGHNRVTSIAEAVMAQIRALALESQRRVAGSAAVRTSDDNYEVCNYRVLRKYLNLIVMIYPCFAFSKFTYLCMKQ
jgi:hypothetical protein